MALHAVIAGLNLLPLRMWEMSQCAGLSVPRAVPQGARTVVRIPHSSVGRCWVSSINWAPEILRLPRGASHGSRCDLEF